MSITQTSLCFHVLTWYHLMLWFKANQCFTTFCIQYLHSIFCIWYLTSNSYKIRCYSLIHFILMTIMLIHKYLNLLHCDLCIFSTADRKIYFFKKTEGIHIYIYYLIWQEHKSKLKLGNEIKPARTNWIVRQNSLTSECITILAGEHSGKLQWLNQR